MTIAPIAQLVEHLSRHLQAVQMRLGQAPDAGLDTPFGEVLDSMGLVEFVARKFIASLLMSSPDRELLIVALLTSITAAVAET